jgi:hypothetical protein
LRKRLHTRVTEGFSEGIKATDYIDLRGRPVKAIGDEIAASVLIAEALLE